MVRKHICDYIPTYWGDECRKCLLGKNGLPLNKQALNEKPLTFFEHINCENEIYKMSKQLSRSEELNRELAKENMELMGELYLFHERLPHACDDTCGTLSLLKRVKEMGK